MASATLGSRSTSSFTVNTERPKSWRQVLLLLFPNGEAPLTALTSKMRSEATDDPEFNWWEKGLPTQRDAINNGAGYTAGATALVVDDGSIFKGGSVVLVERTNEIMFVTSVATNTLTVTRGKGETAAAALLDNDDLLIIGSVHEEGENSPDIRSYAPTKEFNFTQIFRTTLGMTRTAKKTRLRWDKTGPYREAKREALQIHAIEMEKAFLFGQRLEDTGAGGNPRRTTRGMFTWITTNKLTDANTDGVWGDADFQDHFEEVFRFGSSEKLALAGSTALNTITAWAKGNVTINMVPSDQVYGLKIVEVITPFGTLLIKQHPLLSDNAFFRKDLLIIDMDKIVYRYIDDTTFRKNVETPGADASKDEFLTEAGLEVHHEKAHSWFTNMASYAAAG